MFEDATFESTGSIHTRSRRRMLATLLLNGTVLVLLVLIPLLYPEALPHESLSMLLTVPPPPPAAPVQPQRPQRVFHGVPEMDEGTLIAPRRIPAEIARFRQEESPSIEAISILEGLPGATAAPGEVFRAQQKPRVISPAKLGPVRVSSPVAAGLLLRKTLPVYPPIAVVARMEGTVALQATISKAGTIENLRVLDGPPMLRQAALDAVRQWQYRPFLLNGEPVEVETTVNVIFTMNR